MFWKCYIGNILTKCAALHSINWTITWRVGGLATNSDGL